MRKELNILIVEDVPRDAEAIENELRAENMTFVTRRVETRQGLLAELEKSLPDIVLSDFTLPDFNALEALRLLQELDYDIPFILVTGSRSEEVAVECIKEGADDYILKASLKRLPSSIVNVLKKKAAEREKARTEEALRRSEELYRLIAENTRDLISLLDLEGRFIYASPSYQHGLGFTPEELAGTDSFLLIHPDDQPAVRHAWKEALQTREGRTVEFRVRNKAEQWRHFESAGNWIFDKLGQPQRSVIVSRDITERKEAETALRSLPRLIIDAQEAERRRVARELHDSVNQILVSVKFRMQAVAERVLQVNEAAGKETERARLLLERAMQEVRRISHNLRPSELDDLGLVPAVRSLCDEFSERTGVTVDVRFTNLPAALPKDIELNVYRILQEGLNNVERHAAATRADVFLVREVSSLDIQLRDNGCGFDPQAPRARRKKPGMGLVDMKERALAVAGQFHIQGTPKHGTTLSIQIPLPTEEPPKIKPPEKRKKDKDKIVAGR